MTNRRASRRIVFLQKKSGGEEQILFDDLKPGDLVRFEDDGEEVVSKGVHLFLVKSYPRPYINEYGDHTLAVDVDNVYPEKERSNVK